MTIKELTAVVNQASALKQISVAYTEISSNKLKKIRSLVEKNRLFLEELSLVFKVVKQVALQRNALPAKNNKTISILITSNYHFYGSVNQNLTSYFAESMKKSPTDQIIIGKTAKEWFDGNRYTFPYTHIVLKKDFPDSQELDMLVERIKGYSKILVFYSRMRTVLFQVPSFQDITQTSYLQAQPAEDQKRQLFIFEPELTKILNFFETQGMNLLLQQAFLESELSRTASRLVSMDQSQMNADKFIHSQTILLNQAEKTAANSRLLETYTSIILSRKKEAEII